MSDKFFLDTNILVYTFDASATRKRARAQALVSEALETGNGSISFQVVQELLNVALKKFSKPFTYADAQAYLTVVLRPLCQVWSSIELLDSALDISERYRYSFFDSLILAAALKSQSSIMYSEDFQHNQKIQGLTIVDPFR